MTAPPPRPRSLLGAYATSMRLVFLVLAILFALAGFFGGVSLTERDLSHVHWLSYFYYALSLFVFGGVDLGVPVGGPPWCRAMLWAAYFMAPLVTLGAVFEAALRLINSQARRMRRLDNHVVVCGGGRLAVLYVKRLRSLEARVKVVVVERDPNKATLRELADVYHAEILIGDIASNETLASARVGAARQVMLLTGDDFSNLDAAARILLRMAWLHGSVVAHVADLSFLRAIPSQARSTGYETFNSLESAAIHLVQNRLLAVFADTKHRDLVVFVGFGRFGQTVLHQLQLLADDKFGTVIVLDLEANANAVRFANGPGFGDRSHHVIEGHLRHPEVWQRVDTLIGAAQLGDPVFVVGTGDGGMNLQTALDLRGRYPSAHITVRSFGASPFASEVAQQVDLEPLVLADLISSSMPTHWFGGAREQAPK